MPSDEITKPPSPLRQVVGWIIAGHSETDILDAVGKNWPATKPRPLIIQAMQQLAKQGDPDPDLVRGFAIEGTREIYRKALEVADHQTALGAGGLVKLADGK